MQGKTSPMSTSPLSTVQSGEIQFVEGCPPPLEAGNYKITVTQTVDAAPGAFSNTYDFTVRGPRFVLEPSWIHSFFPPPNHQGPFSEALPQIVFNRRTVPWDRTLDGSQPPRGTLAAPWMGLLLVDEGDGSLPEVKTATVGDLLTPAKGGSLPSDVLGPDIAKKDLEPGESVTDVCLTVELPMALFQKIVPAVADLPFLAHARQVEAAGDSTWFSIVLGNRFPQDAAKNTVFLVSLEGFQNHLYGGAQSQDESVRLACLASWSFVNTESGAGFQELMAGLDVWQQNGQPMGRLSLPPAANQGGSEAQKFVKNALEMGYVALHHTTRHGEETVSWNRGPLVPLLLEADQPTTFAAADAALRYDPNSGMFDVSYAAAWQLGRLLALHDPTFATALMAWRRQNLQAGVRAVTRNLLADQLGGLIDIPMEAAALFDEHLPEKLVWRYLREELIPRLGSLLGPPADPSGLAALIGTLPGLLSAEEMAEIMADDGDPIELIRQKLLA